MRSHMKTASSMLCVTSSIDFIGSRRSTQRSRRSVRIVSAVSTSSAENGSSSNRIFGSTTSARAKPTRWRMPPDNSRGYADSKQSRPMRSISNRRDASHRLQKALSSRRGMARRHFLRCNDADTIYLVGDIIDGWRLKKSWYWPQTHNNVVQKVLRKVRRGARVIYIPGNHDEWLRDYTLLQFGGVEVADEAIHVTADGRRLLVMHGDVFDAVVKHARWLAVLGDGAYTAALWLNRHFNIVRRRLGYP